MTQANILLDIWTDEKRHPLILDNKDFDEMLNPALTELGTLYDTHCLSLESLVKLLKLFIEIAYCMGYTRRASEQVVRPLTAG